MTHKEQSNKTRFARVYVEITNVCNLSCSFCAGNSRPPHFMTPGEFQTIIDRIQLYTNHIYLHVLGEPLLHPDLAELLEIAQRAQLQVNITTNGTLLSKVKAVLLNAPAVRKVSISLHSMEAGNGYEQLPYLQQVSDFATQASAQGMLCELRLWNLGVDSIDNATIFAPLCNLLGIAPQAQATLLQDLDKLERLRLRPHLFFGKAARFAWPSLTAPVQDKPIFCHGLRTQIAVLCDGTVTPCCMDSAGVINLGNLHEQSLAQLLSKPRAKALYSGFTARKPSEPLCQRCEFATRF